MSNALAHRHGRRVHAHAHARPHRHLRHPRLSVPVRDQLGHRAQSHSHGLVDDSIKRSREGLRAVGLSLAVLGLTAAGCRPSSSLHRAPLPCSPI